MFGLAEKQHLWHESPERKLGMSSLIRGPLIEQSSLFAGRHDLNWLSGTCACSASRTTRCPQDWNGVNWLCLTCRLRTDILANAHCVLVVECTPMDFSENGCGYRIPRCSIMANGDETVNTNLRALHRSISPPQLDPSSGWSFLMALIVSAVELLPSLSTNLMVQARPSMS